MNVQDVIEKALAGNDGIPVTPVEHTSCENVQVEKLASALNFIGANLESSVADLEKVALNYDLQDLMNPNLPGGSIPLQHAANLSALGGSAGGAVGAVKAREKMRKAGLSEDQIDDALSIGGGTARGVGKSVAGNVLGGLAGMALGKTRLAKNIGSVRNMVNVGSGLGSIGGGIAAYRGEQARADKAIAAAKGRKKKLNISAAKRRQMIQAGPPASFETHADNPIYKLPGGGRKKTASVDNALYHAAQAGKQALLEKVAEDRINPAKISAGAAAPYSGEIMPKGQAVFGGATTPAQLVALKAQKVRNRINKDMKQYVKNVGDGYNLQGHLTKFNK